MGHRRGEETGLGLASGGALRMARRDVVAVWLEREAMGALVTQAA